MSYSSHFCSSVLRRLSESSNFCNFAWLGHQDELKGDSWARLEIPVVRIQPCRIGECSSFKGFSIRSFSASGLNFWGSSITGILNASSRMPISYLVFWETLRVFAAAWYQVSADVIAYGTVGDTDLESKVNAVSPHLSLAAMISEIKTFFCLT